MPPRWTSGPGRISDPLPGPVSSVDMVGLSVAVPPPMLALCSASMRRRPRPSVGCSMKAANCPPRSSSGGTSLASRIMLPPGVASGRSRLGSRCLPCPGSELGHVGPDHRRPDGPCHPCRCGANPPVGGLDRDAGSTRLSGRDHRAAATDVFGVNLPCYGVTRTGLVSPSGFVRLNSDRSTRGIRPPIRPRPPSLH